VNDCEPLSNFYKNQHSLYIDRAELIAAERRESKKDEYA
jgi:hypothetical protein